MPHEQTALRRYNSRECPAGGSSCLSSTVHTVYGALRGLETLSQLIDRVPVDTTADPYLDPTSGMPKDTFNANQPPLQAVEQMIQNCWGTFMQLLGIGHDDHSQSRVPQVVLTHEADAAEAKDHPVPDQDNFFDIVNDIPDHTDDSDSALQRHKKHSIKADRVSITTNIRSTESSML